MPKRLNVLMADLSAADAERVAEALQRAGYEVSLTRPIDVKLDAIAQLASGVAHDFNNLLTAIVAYSDSMLYQLPPNSSLRTEVAEIKKSGERASVLTQRLLAFGRRRAFKPQVTSLNALISGLGPRLRQLLGDRVDIDLQLAPDLGQVRVDTALFEQAILNLATNARDAMPAGGKLTLRTTNVDLRADAPRFNDAMQAQFDADGLAPGWYVSLTVSDTGYGMDADTQARAFDPFFTTRESGSGAGLGLTIVYRAVRQSGGSIAIDSAVGRGTTLRVLLPQAQPEPASEAAPPLRPEGQRVGQNETILLVEDEELVRQMAVLTLERRGYRVLVARDAGEAIVRAQAHAGEIRLLIADLVMPRVGGQELARLLGESHPGLRVLYTIGYGDEALAREAALVNPRATFLHKPFVATALADRVREVLAAERVRAGGHSPGRTGHSPKP